MKKYSQFALKKKESTLSYLKKIIYPIIITFSSLLVYWFLTNIHFPTYFSLNLDDKVIDLNHYFFSSLALSVLSFFLRFGNLSNKITQFFKNYLSTIFFLLINLSKFSTLSSYQSKALFFFFLISVSYIFNKVLNVMSDEGICNVFSLFFLNSIISSSDWKKMLTEMNKANYLMMFKSLFISFIITFLLTLISRLQWLAPLYHTTKIYSKKLDEYEKDNYLDFDISLNFGRKLNVFSIEKNIILWLIKIISFIFSNDWIININTFFNYFNLSELKKSLTLLSMHLTESFKPFTWKFNLVSFICIIFSILGNWYIIYSNTMDAQRLSDNLMSIGANFENVSPGKKTQNELIFQTNRLIAIWLFFIFIIYGLYSLAKISLGVILPPFFSLITLVSIMIDIKDEIFLKYKYIHTYE